MSAINFAKQAFGREKPHSSITDWVDILTAPSVRDESYDGIPELIDSINLQPSAGPGEASRAIRKKLKHGNSHQQYRGIVILKALVDNCGTKFTSSFADGQLTDAIRHLAIDRDVDKRVQKKMLLVLQAWQTQFKGEPSMSVISSLFVQCRQNRTYTHESVGHGELGESPADAKRRVEREEAKLRAKKEKEEEKEKQRKEEEERRRKKQMKNKPKRAPFNFEQEKPKVLSSIVEASQASSNLINAMTLVNRQTDSLQKNERVQEWLAKAKQARKQVVRYIQLVEQEEIIGTLIETNDRVVTALESYDELCAAPPPESDDSEIASGLTVTHITGLAGSEVSRLQEKQRAAVQRAKQRGDESHLHPDLQDLSFGALGPSSTNLPPPLRPTSALSDDEENMRGSLSDFSDYDSSDEGTHNAGPSRRRDYVDVSDNSEDDPAVGLRGEDGNLVDVDDPFADPFADEVAVGPMRT